MATEFRITVIETSENGMGTRQEEFSLVEFLTKAHEAMSNTRTPLFEDCKVKHGGKYKAVADKEPFTITLPEYVAGQKVKDIDFKLDSTENNIIIKAAEGVKVNDLDEMIFSGKHERAAFEYNSKRKSWILW